MSVETFEQACVKYRSDLIAFATRLCRNRDEAQDFVQTGLERAFVAWDAARPNAPRAWLHQIVKNVFVEARRTHHRRQNMLASKPIDALTALCPDNIEYTFPMAAASTHSGSIEYVVPITWNRGFKSSEHIGRLVECASTRNEHRDELDDDMTAALDTLRPIYRQVIDLVDLGGQTYAQAAREIGVPIGTVMSRLNRARAELRVRLPGRGVRPKATRRQPRRGRGRAR